MLSVDEALALVLEHARPRPAAEFGCVDAIGLVLAESIASDVDVPPRDQSVVDGYAVVASDLSNGSAELEVIEEVTAGRWPTHAVTPGRTTRLMTGVAIPDGADAVVMFERSEIVESDGAAAKVRLRDRPSPGQNISRQGSSIRKGATVLGPGAEIRAIERGILAEVGRQTVQVIGRPTVAVLATGDELVDASETPKPGQIRNSNGPMLWASARRMGAFVLDAGVAGDNRESLRQAIERALRADIIVLSGGVSMGIADLAPAVLTELGVEQVFHKVNLKPGKPLWFGVHRASGVDRLVFGLPGNPVSSLVCFELFVRPAIGRLAGRMNAGLRQTQARLVKAHEHRGDRPTYHPARLVASLEGSTIEPLPWRGSGDLASLARANALAHFPAGDRCYEASETVSVFVLE